MGIFDQDVDAKASIRYPGLYTYGISNEGFTRKLFAMDALRGLFSSLILAGFFAGTNSFFLKRLISEIWLGLLPQFCTEWYIFSLFTSKDVHVYSIIL